MEREIRRWKHTKTNPREESTFARRGVVVSTEKQRRIMVVDDDPGIRGALHVALSKAGYGVIQARNGEEALQLWRERADLVITDLHMPERNGIELILDLVALGVRAPIIAITDGGRTKQMELLADARLLGAVRTVQKPFRLEEVLATVDELLDRKGPTKRGA
jgi:DNA-binding response OmpR family regulator